MWHQGRVRREGVQCGDAKANEERLGDVDRRNVDRATVVGHCRRRVCHGHRHRRGLFLYRVGTLKELGKQLDGDARVANGDAVGLLTVCAYKAHTSSTVTFPVAWASA